MKQEQKKYTIQYTRGISLGPSSSGDNGIPRTTTIWAGSREEARILFLNQHQASYPVNSNQMYYVLSVSM
jgi:hypothetical protein